MRKLLIIAVTAVAALSLTATGFADPGKEKKAKKHGKYTFTVTTTDNGSCGTPLGERRRPAHVPRQEEQGRLVHADPSRQGRVHDDRRREPGLV